MKVCSRDRGFALVALVFTACAHVVPTSEPRPMVRFVLTFDDGPSAPTERILETLAHNPTQPGAKAIFFVQTRWDGAGGSPRGHALLQREVTDGHVLALHSGSARGHIAHTELAPEALAGTLRDGNADLKALTGEDVRLVRPPFWKNDAATRGVYERASLSMLLTDISARDGWAVFYQASPTTGGRLNDDLGCFRERIARGSVPAEDGVYPLVVTFHDVNAYTAEHLAEYLETLVRAAKEAGFQVATPAFYADHDSLLKAAQFRAESTHGWRNTFLPSCAD